MKQTGLNVLIGCGVLILALTSCAATPPITDGHGSVIEGSIASLEEVEILGTRQWLLIRGVDEEAPVLLWLAGGPGGSEIGRTRDYLADLENDFVVVNWEQPGTGKSFNALDARSAHYIDFVNHTIAVSEYLAHRFSTDRIYLAGHSWGSIIGLMAADKRPDLYAGFLGIGQQVDFVENDQIGYDMAMERARAFGDTKTVQKLQTNGPPPYGALEKGKYTYLFQRVFRYSPSHPQAPSINEMSIFTPEEYTVFDTIRLVRGLLRGVDHVYPQLVGIDFRRDLPEIQVPVFLFTGRYDYTCVQDMSYEYYQILQAPIKRHYWFELSGHESCYQEPEKFRQILLEEVLPLTTAWVNGLSAP